MSESENTDKQNRFSWWRKGAAALIFLGVIVVMVVFVARRSITEGDSVVESVEPQSFVAVSGEVPGRVLAEDTATDPALLRSENFRLGDVAVGGDVTIASGADSDQYRPLEMSFIRGESMEGKNKSEARILVTWKTSKAANSTLKYGKNTGEEAKSIDEEGYGVNHSVVLAGLDQASTYVYTITVRDRWGNEAESDSYAVYTGAKNVSLFELISGALSETFGWAFKK